MNRGLLVLSTTLCAIAFSLIATPASATPIVFTATLDPVQAGTAALGGHGSGFATVTLDDVLDTVDVSVTFSGLSTPASAAHIHCCALPGTNAPVVVPFPGFPAVTAGTYSAIGLPITPANATGLLAGLAYVNIHDSTFPGGEIRGQLAARDVTTPVPEPASLSLLATGLIAAGWRRRRRSQQPA